MIVLAFVALSCKTKPDDQNQQNELGSIKDPGTLLESIASQYPVAALDELVEPISQEELADVIADGESEHWTSSGPSPDRPEIVVRNKSASDKLIRFVLYHGNPILAMIGVQQENAQVTTTEVWEYWFKVDQDHPERWNQHLLPDYKLESFFDERVTLPGDFHGQSSKPYLDYKLGAASITISLNKWVFMRELELNSISLSGSLDPALVKYKYVLNWNGDDFSEEKLKEAGYDEGLMFTSIVIEPRTDGGPGVHEFDCPHGVSVKTSSKLDKQGNYTYDASNLLTPQTAWSEGVEGEGIGEWVEFTITTDFHIGSSWQIGNGNTRNKEVWAANNRVKKMKVLVDEKVVGYVMLANAMAYQEFNIAPGWLTESPVFRKGTKIRFVIEEVYKGSKYNDTVISYFVPVGNCG